MTILNIQAGQGETVIYTFDAVTLPASYTAKMQVRNKPDDTLIDEFSLIESSGVFTATSTTTFNLGVYMYDLRVENTADNTAQTFYTGVLEIL